MTEPGTRGRWQRPEEGQEEKAGNGIRGHWESQNCVLEREALYGA